MARNGKRPAGRRKQQFFLDLPNEPSDSVLNMSLLDVLETCNESYRQCSCPVCRGLSTEQKNAILNKLIVAGVKAIQTEAANIGVASPVFCLHAMGYFTALIATGLGPLHHDLDTPASESVN